MKKASIVWTWLCDNCGAVSGKPLPEVTMRRAKGAFHFCDAACFDEWYEFYPGLLTTDNPALREVIEASRA